MSVIQEHDFLIVAGTTKAATTSVFRYLSDHPQVAAASYKETRFFLSPSYPLPAPARDATHSIETYERYFSPKPGQLCVESTPDYLHDPATPAAIAQKIPHAKILLLLRNPITRLQSWYKFSQQSGYLSQNISFESYVDSLFVQKKATKQHELVLEQGKYIDSVNLWLKYFPKTIKICWYEELSDYPGKTMQEIASFGKIDPRFYQNYQFRIENATLELHKPGIHKLYHELRYRLRYYTLKISAIHLFFKSLRKLLEPIYLKMNAKKNTELVISPDTYQKLAEYYKPSIQLLAELTKRTPPWVV